MIHFPNHDLSPYGLSAQVILPRKGGMLTEPFVALQLGQFPSPSWNPPVTRETPAALRALADEIEQAWAIMDRRAELEARADATRPLLASGPDQVLPPAEG